MKKITLLVIMIVTAFTLNAQSLVKYHGEINAGYSVGIGTFATNRVNVHTIQGVDISKFFSTGVGIGLDWIIITNFTRRVKVNLYCRCF